MELEHKPGGWKFGETKELVHGYTGTWSNERCHCCTGYMEREHGSLIVDTFDVIASDHDSYIIRFDDPEIGWVRQGLCEPGKSYMWACHEVVKVLTRGCPMEYRNGV